MTLLLYLNKRDVSVVVFGNANLYLRAQDRIERVDCVQSVDRALDGQRFRCH